MKNDFSILEIESPNEKSLICNQILGVLPNWFGVPESIVQYMQQVKSLPLFACKLGDRAIGFVVVEQTDSITAEIIVMGILPEYHRQGIGKKLVHICEKYCMERDILCLTVKTLAATRPSKSYEKTRAFYHAMGFCSQMILTDYWDENNPCLFMIKALDTQVLTAIQMQVEHIEFVYGVKFSEHNNAVLHGGEMSFDEWEQVCINNLTDLDEANFIIRQGNTPVAWLKVNGLHNAKRTAWISMLVVHEEYQQQGIGSFAVQFAEDFARAKGFNALGIHTNVDNIAAQKCYKRLGYTITEEGECTNGDGKRRRGLTFYRDI